MARHNKPEKKTATERVPKVAPGQRNAKIDSGRAKGEKHQARKGKSDADPATKPKSSRWTDEAAHTALTGALPESTVDAPEPPEKNIAWLKACGLRLAEPPIRERRIGQSPSARQAITVREALISELLKIRGKSGRLRGMELNRAQLELERRSSRRNIVLKARQLGVTTYVAARFFINTISREGTLSVQVAHDQRSAEEIFRIVHRFLENLPEWLRKGALVTSRANVRQIVFPMLDSEYRVETAADPNAGRGLTIHNLHCSEVARWPRDVAETLASLRAAVPPHGEIFLESTPAGAGGVFYDEWQHAGETGYTQHFFPWWWDPSYRRRVAIAKFTAEELELMQKHGLDAAQIAFRREIRANFRDRAPEEYAEDAESCFLASGECVFDAELIKKRLLMPAPIVSEDENGCLLTFFPPVAAVNGARAKKYIIGVDPAGGGTTGDYACVQVIDAWSGVQCAELHGHFTPASLAAKVKVLARKYNDALVAVERNNHGHGVLAYLTLDQGYLELYKCDEQPGWVTNVVTRPRMLAQLSELLVNAPQMFLSPRLLEEMRTFIRHPDASCSAAAGAHDDTVMAMAIAHAVRIERVVMGRDAGPEVNQAILPQPA